MSLIYSKRTIKLKLFDLILIAAPTLFNHRLCKYEAPGIYKHHAQAKGYRSNRFILVLYRVVRPYPDRRVLDHGLPGFTSRVDSPRTPTGLYIVFT